jgi:phospholipase/carboxylesterase
MPMEESLLECLEVGPAESASGTVICLHGLGASGDDLAPLVPYLKQPGIRFVFPHAPSRAVTINGGYWMPAWYDILRLGEAGGENEADVRRSAASVTALVAREGTRGVPASRVVLMGFSQGGALALHVGTRHPEPLLGIVVLSGYEVLAEKRAEESPANRETPILFCHGTEDPVVPIARGRAAYRTHAGPGRSWHEFPMEHEICGEELDLLRGWLGARFGPMA